MFYILRISVWPSHIVSAQQPRVVNGRHVGWCRPTDWAKPKTPGFFSILLHIHGLVLGLASSWLHEDFSEKPEQRVSSSQWTGLRTWQRSSDVLSTHICRPWTHHWQRARDSWLSNQRLGAGINFLSLTAISQKGRNVTEWMLGAKLKVYTWMGSSTQEYHLDCLKSSPLLKGQDNTIPHWGIFNDLRHKGVKRLLIRSVFRPASMKLSIDRDQ